MHKSGDYEYEFVQGESARALLLLHGTGGNERDLLPIAHELDPEASLVSVRGNVMENGMARFFRRLPEGTFDRKDLAVRSEALRAFIENIAREHTFTEIVGVGYSNGANMLLHTLCKHPLLIKGAILLRPMSAALPDSISDLSGMRIYIASGDADELVPKGDGSRLESVVRAASGTATYMVVHAGHRLSHEDITRARDWLIELG